MKRVPSYHFALSVEKMTTEPSTGMPWRSTSCPLTVVTRLVSTTSTPDIVSAADGGSMTLSAMSRPLYMIDFRAQPSGTRTRTRAGPLMPPIVIAQSSSSFWVYRGSPWKIMPGSAVSMVTTTLTRATGIDGEPPVSVVTTPVIVQPGEPTRDRLSAPAAVTTSGNRATSSCPAATSVYSPGTTSLIVNVPSAATGAPPPAAGPTMPPLGPIVLCESETLASGVPRESTARPETVTVFPGTSWRSIPAICWPMPTATRPAVATRSEERRVG